MSDTLGFNWYFNQLYRSSTVWSSRITYLLQEWIKLYTDWLANPGPIYEHKHDSFVTESKHVRIANKLQIVIINYEINEFKLTIFITDFYSTFFKFG